MKVKRIGALLIAATTAFGMTFSITANAYDARVNFGAESTAASAGTEGDSKEADGGKEWTIAKNSGVETAYFYMGQFEIDRIASISLQAGHGDGNNTADATYSLYAVDTSGEHLTDEDLKDENFETQYLSEDRMIASATTQNKGWGYSTITFNTNDVTFTHGGNYILELSSPLSLSNIEGERALVIKYEIEANKQLSYFDYIDITYKPSANFEAANFSAYVDSGYTVDRNTLSDGENTVYGYKATLQGDGNIYRNIEASVTAEGDTRKETYEGATLSGNGSAVFYLVTNKAIDTESSSVYCK